MTPASNSEARKRAEAPATTVLVELPVDLAEQYVATRLGPARRPVSNDTAVLVADRIRAALDAQITNPTGDNIR